MWYLAIHLEKVKNILLPSNITQLKYVKIANCTNEDLINILLCTSDPYMSSIRQKWKSTSLELDEEAKQLLQNENQSYLEEIFTNIV